MADTGIRVPFKTHAPLTLPGTLFDQIGDGIVGPNRWSLGRSDLRSIALAESASVLDYLQHCAQR